jgi:hypothetical protein
MPTIFCSRAEPPDPGICPNFCSGSAYCPVVETQPEIAGEQQLEPDAEAVAASSGDHRLFAPRWRRNIPRQPRDMLRRRLHEALDVAARGKVLARCAQHDHADPVVHIQLFEGRAELSRCGMVMMLKGGRSRMMSPR